VRALPRKLLTATLSASLAALAAFAGWRALRPPPADTVVLVDDSEAFAELLRERQAEQPPEPPPAPSAFEPPAGEFPDGYPPPLIRKEFDEELAKRFYGALRKPGQYHFHPQAHLWAAPDYRGRRTFPEHPDGGWTARTNGAAIRKDVEVRDVPPDLRVLVCGDSHTAGLVPNSESYANVLEELLAESDPARSFEVLNAGIGGTSMYDYLGVLEFLEPELRPQVLVVGFYGGNDFLGGMRMYHYFYRLPPPESGPRGGSALTAVGSVGPVAQSIAQVAFFLDNPDDLPHARAFVDTLTVEIARRCEESGIHPVFMYIPPANSAQPDLYAAMFAEPLAALDITWEDLSSTDRLAAQWLAFLEYRGFDHVDLTPIFRASREPCFWFTDLHINTHGHRLAAEALLPLVAAVGR